MRVDLYRSLLPPHMSMEYHILDLTLPPISLTRLGARDKVNEVCKSTNYRHLCRFPDA
jgi:hypothetical protein